MSNYSSKGLEPTFTCKRIMESRPLYGRCQPSSLQYWLKVKLKITLERAINAQRRKIYSAAFSLTSALDGVGG